MRFPCKTIKIKCTKSGKASILFVFLVVFAQQAFAQEQQSRLHSGKIEKTIKSSHTNKQVSNLPLSETQINEQIDQINEHLVAIEAKRQWINANPDRIAEAKENDWFEAIKSTEMILIKQREELISQLKKMN